MTTPPVRMKESETTDSCSLSSVESVRRTRKLQEKRNRYGKTYPLQSHLKKTHNKVPEIHNP